MISVKVCTDAHGLRDHLPLAETRHVIAGGPLWVGVDPSEAGLCLLDEEFGFRPLALEVAVLRRIATRPGRRRWAEVPLAATV